MVLGNRNKNLVKLRDVVFQLCKQTTYRQSYLSVITTLHSSERWSNYRQIFSHWKEGWLKIPSVCEIISQSSSKVRHWGQQVGANIIANINQKTSENGCNEAFYELDILYDSEHTVWKQWRYDKQFSMQKNNNANKHPMPLQLTLVLPSSSLSESRTSPSSRSFSILSKHSAPRCLTEHNRKHRCLDYCKHISMVVALNAF